MIQGAQRAITDTLEQCEGVVSAPHRFGGTEYRLGTREIGHVHGDRWVDIPFSEQRRRAERERTAPRA